MGIRFRKSIKIGNLLKLNISKSGVSATVGKKGASVNIGSKGTYLNLSPTVAGITGTGLSYRQKITGGYGNAISGLLNKKDKKENIKEEKVEPTLDTSLIDEYYKNYEANTNIHKYCDDVLNNDELKETIDNLKQDSSKEIYSLAMSGDEDTIESLVGAFLNNLDLSYKVDANYELEDHVLYVDLDLPEIEDLGTEYPTVVKNEVVMKKKAAQALKEEYALTVLSLGIYVAANFFNISSYIEKIVLSAFTTRRDNNGELKDEYLYSVKYERNVFEDTNLEEVESAYDFLSKFESRINMSSTYTFKPIKPYESEVSSKEESIVEDAIAGLKELGYKASDINPLMDKLKKEEYNTAGELIKAALKILNQK